MRNAGALEPTWKRLGFPSVPDKDTSGKNVGIVIIDSICPHSTIQHLGKRLQYIIVDDELKITCRNIAFKEHEDYSSNHGEHGLMV